MADEPIMTDMDADDAPGGASHMEPDHKKRNWIVRFASIFGLASAGQGSGGPGMGSGPMGGGG